MLALYSQAFTVAVPPGLSPDSPRRTHIDGRIINANAKIVYALSV